jgi:hypothetical protein
MMITAPEYHLSALSALEPWNAAFYAVYPAPNELQYVSNESIHHIPTLPSLAMRHCIRPINAWSMQIDPVRDSRIQIEISTACWRNRAIDRARRSIVSSH